MIMLMMLFQALKLGFLASLVGYTSAFLFQVANPSPADTQPNWYNSPAFIAGVMSTATVFALKYYETRKAEKLRKEKGSQETAKVQVTHSEAMAELTQQGWQAYLTEIKDLTKQREDFLHAKILELEVDGFRDKEIKHSCFGEIQRLQAHIRKLDVLLTSCCKEAPEFEFKYQNDIIAGVDSKVDEFRLNQRRNLRAASGAPDRTES